MDSLEVRNPATRELVGRVPIAAADDVRDAAAKAREAQQRWQNRTFAQRAAIVRIFHDRILDRQEQILDTIQSETGKARRDALAELLTVAGTARYYLAHGERHLSAKRHRPAVPALTTAEVIYKPLGIVGLITPWNYPFLLTAGDSLPALLAGNGVLIKPSELTPLSAVMARTILVDSGLDPDLVSVVHGSGATGAELIRHVDYVGFTGGTSTGRKVAIAAAERLIPYSLELGGKNPMIVLAGASLENAAKGLLAGAFSNSGQTCIAVERAYVQQSIYEEFARRVAEGAARLKLGWSNTWDVEVGSMISETHARKVLAHIDDAKAAGATVLAGGNGRSDLGPTFVEPTVLANVTEGMSVAKEETFGPVVSLFPVRNAEEAVRLANDSIYGLNASVWAGGRGQAMQIARQLETGSAAINATLLIYSSFDVPMGGVKQSGVGRRHGEHGIIRFTQSQSIVGGFARGGGYDALAVGTNSQRMADFLVRAVRLWRRIPGIR